MLLLDPTIIKQLKEREGFESKEQLIDWVHKNTTVTVGEWLDNFYACRTLFCPLPGRELSPLLRG